MAFTFREMSTTYGRHPGGFIWAVVEPIAAIAILSIIFSFAFRAPAIGDNFALFYASGYLPFMMYSELAGKLAQSIKFSKPLLTYPIVNFFDALMARFILNLMVHIFVFCVVIFLVTFFEKHGMYIKFEAIFLSLGMAIMLGLGVGTCNCFFSTRFPVWDRIWSILSRPMFIISGIFFTFESIPEPFKSYLWYNPLIHVVGQMRSGFYPTYRAQYVSIWYVVIMSLLLFIVGLILLNRNHRRLMNNF